jgi:hypothetical protein
VRQATNIGGQLRATSREGEGSGRTNKKAPEKFGVGTRTVEYAVAVIKDAPAHGQTGTPYCRNGATPDD